jgi:hypothetical protein
MRLTVAVVLLIVVVAIVAWNRQPPEQTASPVEKKEQPQPVDKARKPASTSATDPRDTSRDRPDRERTSRPGGQ